MSGAQWKCLFALDRWEWKWRHRGAPATLFLGQTPADWIHSRKPGGELSVQRKWVCICINGDVSLNNIWFLHLVLHFSYFRSIGELIRVPGTRPTPLRICKKKKKGPNPHPTKSSELIPDIYKPLVTPVWLTDSVTVSGELSGASPSWRRSSRGRNLGARSPISHLLVLAHLHLPFLLSLAQWCISKKPTPPPHNLHKSSQLSALASSLLPPHSSFISSRCFSAAATKRVPSG